MNIKANFSGGIKAIAMQGAEAAPIKGVIHAASAIRAELSEGEGIRAEMKTGGYVKGLDGKSAYQIAVENGFEGTEEEWLASLKGDPAQVDAEQVEQIIVDYLEKNPIEGVTPEQVEQAVESALQQAKESGEFDGEKGDDGGYYTPSVDDSGILTWEASKAGMPSVSAASIKGKDGYTPIKGKDYFDGEPGYTPVKGIDYFDGKQGDPGYTPQKGIDYSDGQDGISPTVSVQDISGGHRVTITDKDGEKTFDVMDGKNGTGGGESSAIIDVVKLPETDIREDALYRLLTGVFYFNGIPLGDWTCYVVNTLPNVGEPVTVDMVHALLYYAVDTGSVSGYIPSELGDMVGVPAGWYSVELLAPIIGTVWGGIIWDESETWGEEIIKLILKYEVYCYKQEWWNLSDKAGWRSKDGAGAEVFNTLRNVASGGYSHAEGNGTTASGECSHAEGDRTTASGECSHAEGAATQAIGDFSHAEGSQTLSIGKNSHAEGSRTEARGECSHAEGDIAIAYGKCSHTEGKDTIARGDYSHAEGLGTKASARSLNVLGEYNSDEITEDPSSRGKYVHIVGNGRSNFDRSNAHTLDWDGNAWYAGTLECTGILLTSPNGTKYKITVSDDGTLTATAQ